MSVAGWRRAGWLAALIGVPLAYLAVSSYADHARSMEAVLGLFHGDPLWHVLVATATLALRLASYLVLGGALVAWPLEEVLLARARRE